MWFGKRMNYKKNEKISSCPTNEHKKGPDTQSDPKKALFL
jgi:hypothetical protein